MKKLILILFFSALAHSGYMQTISIEDCYLMARKNYPLIKQYDLIEKSKEYNLANAAKSYLPQLSLNARASWQSDITEFPDEFTTLLNQMGIDGIDFPSQDQYRIALELYQTIWDGGLIAYQQQSIKAQAEVDKQILEVNIYFLYNQINQLFFGILLLDEQLRQNELFQKELERNHKRIESFMNNGLASQSDLNKIKVEQLTRQQNADEMKHQRKAFYMMLSLLTGQALDENTTLEKPVATLPITDSINRPELRLYEAQTQLLSTQKKGILVKGMPRINLFAQGAYADPGLNMFKSGFTPYFIGGISLSWNFSGLYTYKNDNNNIIINKHHMDIQRETFLFNLNRQLMQTRADIEKAKELIKKDDEIIELREQIKQTSEIKVENGTLSINDYLQDLVMYDIAKQNKSLHEMQLLLTLYKFNIEKGY